MPESLKRAWRYAVIAHGGSGTEAIGGSPYILDWQNLGAEYTWTIYNLTTMEAEGFITGRLLDKGYVDGSGYKSDAELHDDRSAIVSEKVS